MAKETIMLCCAAGMSTSLLVTKMREAAEKQGKDAEIFAVSASEADHELDSKKIDVVLLVPTSSLYAKRLQEKISWYRNNGADIPLAVIDMRAYGMMDGAAVVTQAYELMGK
ncbi:PTS sugar transporter subunit IIB [Enterococcus cecorum]